MTELQQQVQQQEGRQQAMETMNPTPYQNNETDCTATPTPRLQSSNQNAKFVLPSAGPQNPDTQLPGTSGWPQEPWPTSRDHRSTPQSRHTLENYSYSHDQPTGLVIGPKSIPRLKESDTTSVRTWTIQVDYVARANQWVPVQTLSSPLGSQLG
ncbi:hypothetical protein BJ085DRAFT_32278 [Dimargaris cristalligena]|uniref:Uncharacterized protein n=1 Tax=Dimargaris cristalligena TaxID=215637 RepID=A0A4P9ZL96_9FUNG|nr:hypothetical protein BJ085DRAFT_32278 [Dimargaris cristalligena]|eukprot:RKP33858.1 hypothetical protein BJ085DRAFT_32278 [Dimargaris cristalligena]